MAALCDYKQSEYGKAMLPFSVGKVIEIDTGMQPAYVPPGRASALGIRAGVFTAIYTDRRDLLPIPPR